VRNSKLHLLRFYEDHYIKIFTGHGVESSGSTYNN
jgi:hypothetical protein